MRKRDDRGVELSSSRRMRWGFRRARGERGASLVEFAFILPILLLIGFGIVEFGVAFNNNIALRQGAREGARAGVVAEFGSTASCNLTPAPASTDTQKLMCLAKSRIDPGNTDKVRVKLQFVNNSTGTVDATKNQVGDTLRVCAQRELSSTTSFPPFGAMLNNKKLSTKVDMRIEEPLTTVIPAEENSLSGSWVCS